VGQLPPYSLNHKVIYCQSVEGPIHISRENSQVYCRFWSFSQGGVLLSWHCLQYVGIPSDHKFFAGHLINYKSNAFSAVNDKEAARFCSSQNQKTLLPTVDRLKRFLQMLADEMNAENGSKG